jgi:putative peptidoglycan lipid II flippase
MNKIKQLINGKNSVKGATVILIVTLFLSNILGMLRDHFITQKISTDLLDTYYAAFRIPDLIFNILILGAIAAAFIPVFTTYVLQRQEKEAWRVTNSFINIGIIALIIFAIILYFLMPYLIPILVGKFGAVKQNTTIELARIMLLSPIFFGISYIMGGVLNSYKRFLVYSIAPLIYNLSIIIATLLFADKYNVYGVVGGVLVGAFLHMIVQIPATLKLGYRYQFLLEWKNEGVRKIFKLMMPRALGLGAMQIMLLVYTSIASTLGAGSVAYFNLADNIQTMPIVVFGTSFATAIFPSLSEAISIQDKEKFTSLISKGIRSILFLLIPSGVGIILLRTEIIRSILGYGSFFKWEQTINTADILGFFAISLFAQGLIPLLARSFYALHDTKTPMTISIISFVTSIVFGYILAPIMGITGLGLAFSIGSFVNAVLLYLILRKNVAELKTQESSLFTFILKILSACLIMTIFIQLDKYVVGHYVAMDKVWGVFLKTISAIAVGSGVYVLITYLLKCEEIDEIVSLFKKKFNFAPTEENS